MIRRMFARSLGIAAVLAFSPAQAATPASGTISLDSRELSYEAGPFLYRNPTAGAIFVDAICNGAALPCDDYLLTVDLPAAYVAANPDDVIVIQWKWPNPVEDYDYSVLDESGAVVISAGTASDPENATFAAKPGKYTLRGLPFLVAGGSFTGSIRLAGPVEAPALPLPAGSAPEFVPLTATGTLGGGAAEPSIGFNPKTGRVMYLSSTQTLRATFPEKLPEPQPEVCDPLWEDVSFAYTGVITADPILFTDQDTGRTFVSQMHIPVPVPPTAVGLNSIFAYTDDDGETWVPGQIGPPEGGYDHQTVGSGPYPESLAALRSPLNGGSAVYYCSQAGVTAFCARSDTGGLTFPTGFPIYDAQTDGFGGIHGHVKVAPDGTVYVPVKACGEEQCVTMSEDGGVTWEVRRVPGAAPGASDPAVGIAKDGTVYFCYADGSDGRAHVAVSRDKGATWANDYDIGAQQKVYATVFAQATAGDPDRAACAFLGSDRGGNFQALDFPGVWHGYVSTTYDGGKTWATVNVTPNQPVQRETGIWLSGGGAKQRNLLDFNDITIDDQGRSLFGFADGCVGDCEIGGENSFASKAVIARQIGGRPLFAQFDPPEGGMPPGRACLAGERDTAAAHLSWRVPNTGGAQITKYKIFRGTSAGAETELAVAPGDKPRFDDFTADPSVAEYSYKVTAVNARGESLFSNTVSLPLKGSSAESPCALPGVTIAVDASGDSTSDAPGTDLRVLSVAEPKDMDGKLVITLKVDGLSPAPAPGHRWGVVMSSEAVKDFFVAMVTDQGAPRFVHGRVGEPAGGTVGTYDEQGELGDGSGYTTDGTIVLVIDKALLGSPAAGALITDILAKTRTSAPGNGAGLTLDDSGAVGNYRLREPDACSKIEAAPPPPLATPAVQGDVNRFGGGLALWPLLLLLAGVGVRQRT